MMLQFKFREQTSPKDRDRVVKQMQERAVRVERLFPAADDLELAALYAVLIDNKRAAAALRLLSQDDAVEYAEREAPRKLQLPRELKRKAS